MKRRQLHPIPGQFEFEVLYEPIGRSTPWDWEVRLPHQCDEWIISQGGSPAAVLPRLDMFIAEAQAARAKLAELAEEAS